MFNINKLWLVPIAAMAVLSVPVFGQQQPTDAAPVPAQIMAAKKVFISNAGEERNPNGDLDFSGGPDRAYNQFYAAMKNWGQYDLASSPADADLVIEIRLAAVNGSRVNGSTFYDQLKLEILDPKTHTTLWTFVEHAVSVGRQKTRDAAFDRAMTLFVGDLKKLAGATAVGAGAPNH
jgi:hypothetical protein